MAKDLSTSLRRPVQRARRLVGDATADQRAARAARANWAVPRGLDSRDGSDARSGHDGRPDKIAEAGPTGWPTRRSKQARRPERPRRPRWS